MVELLQCGSELLMSTAWRAIKREDKTPYNKDRDDGTAVTGMEEDGATPMKNPNVTTAAADKTFFVGEVRV